MTTGLSHPITLKKHQSESHHNSTYSPLFSSTLLQVFMIIFILSCFSAAEPESGASAQEAFVDEGEKCRWIDSVEIRHVLSGTLIVDKKKRKGEVVIGEDDVLGFVTGEYKVFIILGMIKIKIYF